MAELDQNFHLNRGHAVNSLRLATVPKYTAPRVWQVIMARNGKQLAMDTNKHYVVGHGLRTGEEVPQHKTLTFEDLDAAKAAYLGAIDA